MGLSRNKVAVSEGAAGSPPFYGEREISQGCLVKVRIRREPKGQWEFGRRKRKLLFNFQGLIKAQENISHGGVAQLGEHLPCKQGVMGSNPIISTTVCSSGG